MEINPKQKETIEMVRQKEAKKELKFLGTLRPHKGQRVYQCDLKTMLVTEAKMDARLDYTGQVKKKLVTQDGCIYAVALNVKNAGKKFVQIINKMLLSQ